MKTSCVWKWSGKNHAIVDALVWETIKTQMRSRTDHPMIFRVVEWDHEDVVWISICCWYWLSTLIVGFVITSQHVEAHKKAQTQAFLSRLRFQIWVVNVQWFCIEYTTSCVSQGGANTIGFAKFYKVLQQLCWYHVGLHFFRRWMKGWDSGRVLVVH